MYSNVGASLLAMASARTTQLSDLVFQQLFSLTQDIFQGEAELFEQGWRRRRLAVGGHADHTTFQAHVLVPVVGMGGFDGDTRADLQRQYRLLVARVLGIEDAGARHRHHTNLAALLGQLVVRLHRQAHFRTGRDQDQLRLARAILQHITTAADVVDLHGIAGLVLQVLPGEDQRRRTVLALQGVFPGHGGFHRVGWTPGVEVRRATQARQLLDRLVGRTVFAQTDGVMGVDMDHALLHQRRHTYRVAGVFHEHQEGRAVRQQAAVQGDAVHDRGHAEFAHAVVHVVAAGVFSADALATFPQGQVGTGQVGRTAEQFRQQWTEGVQGVLAGFTAGDGFALGRDFSDVGRDFFGEVSRQLAAQATHQLIGFGREGCGVGRETLVPLGFDSMTGFLGIPLGIDVGRDFERAVVPLQRRAGQGDFRVTQWGAVAVFLALLVRRTEADGGLAADQGRTVAFARGLDGGLDLFRIMTVDIADHLPVVGLETLGRIVGEPAFDFAVDGDAVVVIEGDQLAQVQGTGQGSDFVGNAFHHAAITEEHIGVVVDDVVAGTVELRRQDFFRQGEAHGVGQALAERTGGGFHARGVAVFRVTWSAAVQLTEVLQVVDRQVVAGQVQQRVDQHRAMAVGQHEAVTVGERRVARVVLQVITPQYFGNIRHTHGGTGMAAVGFLHGIHAEGTNGVGTLTTAGHR